MPRDAITLADVHSPTLGLVCDNVERLIAKHGAGMRLPELLTILANCEKARSVSIYDRCKAL
jgi:hypothetical protein